MIVSFSVSPFEELVVLASEKPIILPPNRFTAVSKLNRVRVDGSKNRVATTFPSNNLRFGFASKYFMSSSSSSISSFVKSEIETRLLFCISYLFFNKTSTFIKKANPTQIVLTGFFLYYPYTITEKTHPTAFVAV